MLKVLESDFICLLKIKNKISSIIILKTKPDHETIEGNVNWKTTYYSYDACNHWKTGNADVLDWIFEIMLQTALTKWSKIGCLALWISLFYSSSEYKFFRKFVFNISYRQESRGQEYTFASILQKPGLTSRSPSIQFAPKGQEAHESVGLMENVPGEQLWQNVIFESLEYSFIICP